MSDKPDADKLKGPGGLSLRQVHEQVKLSVKRDREAARNRNSLIRKESRWIRFVHYVWDKKQKG